MKYDPQHCNTVMEMMKQGFTQEEVCAAIGVTPKQMIQWRKAGAPAYHEEFAEAYDHAKVHQKAFWLSRGRDNIGEGRDFNTPLFTLYMANLFGWRGGAAKDDELMEEIRELKRHLGIGDDE